MKKSLEDGGGGQGARLHPIVLAKPGFGVCPGAMGEGHSVLSGTAFSIFGVLTDFFCSPQDNLYLLPARGAGEGIQ